MFIVTATVFAAVLGINSIAQAAPVTILVDPDMVWDIHDVKNVGVSAQEMSGGGFVGAPGTTLGNLTVGAGPTLLTDALYFNYLRYQFDTTQTDLPSADALHITKVDFEGVAGVGYDGTTRYRADVTQGGPLQSRILAGPFPGNTDQVEVDYFASLSGQPCYTTPFSCGNPSGTGDGVGTGDALIAASLGVPYLAVKIYWADDANIQRAIDTFNFDITENTDGNNPPQVPEPASLLLLGSGLVAVGSRLRRKTNG